MRGSGENIITSPSKRSDACRPTFFRSASHILPHIRRMNSPVMESERLECSRHSIRGGRLCRAQCSHQFNYRGLILAVAGFNTTESSGGKMTTENSLYDRLGGKPAIEAVVNDVLDRLGAVRDEVVGSPPSGAPQGSGTRGKGRLTPPEKPEVYSLEYGVDFFGPSTTPMAADRSPQ